MTRTFIERVTPEMSPCKYAMSPLAKLNETVLIRIYSAGGDSFRARFLMNGRNFMRFAQTYDDRNYFLRVYSGEQMVYLEATLNETILMVISSQTMDEITSLDTSFHGDYLESNRTNCYSTIQLLQGGDFQILTRTTDFTLHITPGHFPTDANDRTYVYASKDFAVQPEAVGHFAVRVPVLKASLKGESRVYVCLEGMSGFAYSVKVGKHEMVKVQPGKEVKLYLHGNDRLVMVYSELMEKNPVLQITLNQTEGCFNVLVKHRQSSYYGELIAKNLTAGVSQFKLLTENDLAVGDTMMVRVLPMKTPLLRFIKAPAEDSLCTGTDLYTECPTYFVFETCGGSSSSAKTHFTLEHGNDPVIMPSEGFLLLVLARSEKKFIIPKVAPAVEVLEVSITQRKLMTPVIMGRFVVTQKNTEKTIVEDISGRTENITIEFKKEEGRSLEGDYYVTIEGFQTVNVRLETKMYSKVGGKLVEVVNSRLPSTSSARPLTFPIGGNKKAGYFSFYAKNATGTSMAVIISPHGTTTNLKAFYSTTSWFTKGTLIDNCILRVPRSGMHHYLTVEAECGKTGGEAGASLTFLESQRFSEVKAGYYYSFQGTRVFHLKVEKGKEYVIRKSGETVETVYLSLDPSNPIPFSDKNTRAFGHKEGVQEIVLSEEDLKSVSEVCFTVFCHTSECYYHLQVEKVARPGSPKADL